MNKEARKKSIARRAVLYSVITTGTVVIASVLALYTFGFRFDLSLNKVERTGLVQFSSSPSGAVSRVDGSAVQFRTPNKSVVNAGEHHFSMERNNYHDWEKTLNIKPGILMWLNYAILVPKKIETNNVAEFENIHQMLASPEKKDILLLVNENAPQFKLVDIRSNEPKIKELEMPLDVYTGSDNIDMRHRFEITEWDEGGRYVSLKHYYDESYEWLVMDTQNLSQTKNLTTHFDIDMQNVRFIDTSGNKFYALSGQDLRKIDLSASTISHPIITQVEYFTVYDKNYITYIGLSESKGKARRVVGTYRDGDKTALAVKSFSKDQTDIKIGVTEYFNEDYIAIVNNKVLTLLSGKYPSDSGSAKTLKSTMTLSLDWDPEVLSFSSNGQRLLLRRGVDFVTYDLEYRQVSKFSVDAPVESFESTWINDSYIWSWYNDRVSIREFDGLNGHAIVNASHGYGAVLTNNKKYIYTINKTATGYSLQQSLMILK